MKSKPWYPDYPADYLSDTEDLTLLQHGAYCLLLKYYYRREAASPPSREAISHLLRVFTKDEWSAVEYVLNRFFVLKEDGWHNKRADEEIAKRNQLYNALSDAGKRGVEAKKTLREAASPPSSPPATQLTTNNLHLTSNKKDKTQKDKTFSSDSVEIRLSKILLAEIKKNRQTFKEPNLQTWAKQFDAIMRIDKRPEDEIIKIIEWCQSDAFWKSNILSPDKLRKKYDQLSIKMTSAPGSIKPWAKDDPDEIIEKFFKERGVSNGKDGIS